MVRSLMCGWMGAVLVLHVLGLPGWQSGTLAAAPPDLDAQLEAGEFAPALAALEAAPPADRDAGLRAVAAAQADAGMRSKALSTLGAVRSEEVRQEGLRGFPQPRERGGFGGAPRPDFETLIELITSTVAPQSWDEVGGPGTIERFPLGVLIDNQGFVRRALKESQDNRLSELRSQWQRPAANRQVERLSTMRKVSLNRLERQIQLRQAAGQPLDAEMKCLAGLQRVKHVLVYPETGDVVLAGPAGAWRTDEECRQVSVENNHPVLQLDDLVVLLRQAASGPSDGFTCSIEPNPANLARTKEFLDESSKRPLKAGKAARDAWLAKLSEAMGEQAVEYHGIDPRSRVARVMFEADYRMKLVGIGVEEGVLGLTSYLDLVEASKNKTPPLGVLRWWFTLNYKSVTAGPDRNVYEFQGPGCQVQSENEMLNERGQRVHTGEAEPLNQEFAQSFNKHFEALAQKYPVYADLQGICDLALAAALLQAENLPSRVGWSAAFFRDPEQYVVAAGPAPKQVQTVLHHRYKNGKILAAASGGVELSPGKFLQENIKQEKSTRLDSEYGRARPEELTNDAWWWD